MKLLFSLLAAAAAASTMAATASPASARPHCQGSRKAITFYIDATRAWEAQHDAALTPGGDAKASTSCRYVRWAAVEWRHRSLSARHSFDVWFSQMDAKWGCIHRHEGAWDAHNAGYGGGLQMDSGFQSTYGAEFIARWGPAGMWPVWAQYLAAERAYHGYNGYRGRGYTPWPNTAAACGLL